MFLGRAMLAAESGHNFDRSKRRKNRLRRREVLLNRSLARSLFPLLAKGESAIGAFILRVGAKPTAKPSGAAHPRTCVRQRLSPYRVQGGSAWP
jgi:hypothetical protein